MRLILAALTATLALGFCVITSAPARSASSMAANVPGAGPHSYDFLIGTWSCKNSVPSALGGPAATTITISRSSSGPLAVRIAGTGFEALAYVVYNAKTKTWWSPEAVADGSYGTESTQQTGKKTFWTGPYTSAGKTVQQRDTFTWGTTSYTDLFQVETGGTWKTEGNSTCTKT